MVVPGFAVLWGQFLHVWAQPVLLPIHLVHLFWALVFCCWGRMEPRQVVPHTMGWVVGSPHSPCLSFPIAVLPLSSLLMLPGCSQHQCLHWGGVEMDRQTESSEPAQLQGWGVPHLTSYALPPPRLLQLGGDLEDLESALNRSSPQRVLGSGSCSALVKLLPGHRDLLVAHDTWTSYQAMLRIIKKYTLPFRASAGGAWAGLGGLRLTSPS